ncbi:MAG TPA: hypothetical protein VD971_00880 [Phycisphaerales bacterium]|nr:hypothetical protein [Phycisphaerales bacterium]
MKRAISSVLAFCAGGATAFGGIVGTGGDAIFIAAPASTALGALESDPNVHAFNEASNLVLSAGLPVNATTPGIYTSNGSLTPGIIPAGTAVNSHYIYSDPVGGGLETYQGFVDFDAPILGVIILRAALNGTDALLGAPGTVYADNAARGMELSQGEHFTITISGTRLIYDFDTSSATDDIRVITAVPTPAGVGLAAACGLLAMRRRRR